MDAFSSVAQNTFFAGRRLHLGICGSIACYKMADALRALLKMGLHVSATLTDGARQFVTPGLFEALGAMPVFTNHAPRQDCFGEEAFAHLEPGQRAEAMLIAPASADALARLAGGRACDMLSAQALAFDGPLLIAPAMNPRMWANAATQENVATLRRRGARILAPGNGSTACGDQGQGRLVSSDELLLACLQALAPQDMAGLRVMITLGPTREPWDGVRFWSNPSSGRMGAALATAAWKVFQFFGLHIHGPAIGFGALWYWALTLLGGWAVLLIFEPILLAAWGYTPGKWILGLRVRREDGRKLAWDDAVVRTAKVFLYGYGLGIPFINLWRLGTSQDQCQKDQVMPWDKEVRYTVGPLRLRRGLGMALCLLLAAGLDLGVEDASWRIPH
ncbi:flavoprotein, partial [uncultured Desulfovibrio sp.]|uniref:flavoprotein n=1 Tax=uncultured Desulfovibrio sp. TaxID=167968 RepID=UPI00261448CD